MNLSVRQHIALRTVEEVAIDGRALKHEVTKKMLTYTEFKNNEDVERCIDSLIKRKNLLYLGGDVLKVQN